MEAYCDNYHFSFDSAADFLRGKTPDDDEEENEEDGEKEGEEDNVQKGGGDSSYTRTEAGATEPNVKSGSMQLQFQRAAVPGLRSKKPAVLVEEREGANNESAAAGEPMRIDTDVGTNAATAADAGTYADADVDTVSRLPQKVQPRKVQKTR